MMYNAGMALRDVMGGGMGPGQGSGWMGQMPQPHVFDVQPQVGGVDLFGRPDAGNERSPVDKKILGMSPETALLAVSGIGALGDIYGGWKDRQFRDREYGDYRKDVEFERDRNRRAGQALMAALGR